MRIGVREFRTNLKSWIARAAAGEEIVITERGKPVARLAGAAEEDTLRRLIAEGIVRPPRRHWKPTGAEKPLRARGSIADLLAEQRR